ncbi:hypothetical protein JOF58_003261 [Streptomyces cinnamonensis]|nr:hypothetical protein [Streptomyces virginiae]
MTVLLVKRRHVDYMRVTTTSCQPPDLTQA